MKLTKQKLKQIIKEELNEISKKQRSHEERLAQQMAQKEEARNLRQELRNLLDRRFEIYVRFPPEESKYVVVVSDHRQRLQDARDQLALEREAPRDWQGAREERLEKLIARLENYDDHEERGQQEALDLQDDLDPILHGTGIDTLIELVDDRFAVIAYRAWGE